MTTPVLAAHAKLKAALIHMNFSLADIFEFLSEYIANEQGDIARALSLHMRDFMYESSAASPPIEVTFPEMAAEAYRRTFCDVLTAAKYGTVGVVADTDTVIQMLEGVAANLIEFANSETPQHVLDLIDMPQQSTAH